MKKTIFALLIVVLLFAFVACDNQTSIQGPSNAIIDNSVELNTVAVSNEIGLRAAILNPEVEAIELESDISLTQKVVIDGYRDLVLDLNGCQINCNNNSIAVKENSRLTIKDDSDMGEISSTGSYPLYVTDSAQLIVDGGRIGGLDSTFGICAFNQSTLLVRGGYISSNDTGIATNNLVQSADGSKYGVNIIIDGGVIEAPVGVYYPSLGSLAITDKATIIGIDVVVVKGGTVRIFEGANLVCRTPNKLADKDNVRSAINWNNGWDAAIGADVIIVSNPVYANSSYSYPFDEITILGDRNIIVAMSEMDSEEGGKVRDSFAMKYVKEDESNLYVK